MTIWGPLPDKMEQKFKKHLNLWALEVILKWFPDGHGAHSGVGGVNGSGP